MKQLAAALCALALAGCASLGPPTTTEGGVPIDATHVAKGQDSRSLFLVIHYTVLDLQKSLHVLTQQEVSSHYLLSDETPPRIFRLLELSLRLGPQALAPECQARRFSSTSLKMRGGFSSLSR